MIADDDGVDGDSARHGRGLDCGSAGACSGVAPAAADHDDDDGCYDGDVVAITMVVSLMPRMLTVMLMVMRIFDGTVDDADSDRGGDDGVDVGGGADG